MDPTKENAPVSGRGAEGAEQKSLDRIDQKYTFNDERKQALAELFDEPRWVPYALVPSTTTPGKLDKIPHTGKHGLSTKKSADWMPYTEAAAIAERPDLNGVGLVMTGGIDSGDWRLVGLDFDDVNFDKFTMPWPTYAERSPSGTGIRAFLYVPLAFAAKYRDTMDAKPDDCAHAEVYFGTTPRFLTVTFDVIDDHPIARIDDPADLKRLTDWGLNKFEVERPLILPERMGEVLNLADFELKDGHLRVATGQCMPEDNKSDLAHGLLLALFNQGILPDRPDASVDDVFATLVTLPGLQKYLLSHRRDDGAAAIRFAVDEVGRAWEKSIPGMQAYAASFAKPKANPDTPAEPDRYHLPTISERVKRKRKPRFAIGRQFLKESTTFIVGDTGAGKTTFCVYTAVCKAHALRDPTFLWNGMPIYDPRPQQYIAGEDDIGVEDMVIGYCMELGIPLEGLPLRISEGPYDLSAPGEVEKLKAACAADLDQYGKLPDWTGDTWSRIVGALDENSATDMRIALALVDELRVDASATIPHHNGVGLKAQNRERGSSVLRKDPTANFTCWKDGEFFHLKCEAQRGAKKPDTLIMQFKEVEVGRDYDDDGNDIGPRLTYILLPVGKAHRAMLADKFYEANPELAEHGRRKYLRTLLAQILNQPGEPQGNLAELCQVTQPKLRRTLAVLRSERFGFVIGGTKEDKRKLQLTQAGIEALRELEIDVAAEFKAAGVDVQMLAKVEPLTPALAVASVTKKGGSES